jgi:hypothetical protein
VACHALPIAPKTRRQRLAQLAALLGLILAMTLGGCAHLNQVNLQVKPASYIPVGEAPELVRRYAPVFVVHNPHQIHNRIGSPKASLDEQGLEVIEIDPDKPAVFYQTAQFKTKRASYTNIFYRVHYPATPASLIPFFIGWGNNMGNFIVITFNDRNQPVLVTTVGTCGCYAVSIPTTALPAGALPIGWSGQPLEIYGETLPPLLDYAAKPDYRLLVEFRPGEHRVMAISLAPLAGLMNQRVFEVNQAKLLPLEDLERLHLGEGSEGGGGHTSFYYQSGPLYGHVKGAYKPLETLFLGIITLDLVVGMDKAYGYKANPFYTSIKPWARLDSDMNDFPRFLRYWGWRL